VPAGRSKLTAREAVPLVRAPPQFAGFSGKYPQTMRSTDHQRRRLLAILAQWVFATARAQPMVIFIEDLLVMLKKDHNEVLCGFAKASLMRTAA
jgi:hypothetical protein